MSSGQRIIDGMKEAVAHAQGLHENLAACHPSIARGQVWCRACGGTKRVDPTECFRSGWPTCCGYTMTIDAPEDRT